MASHSQMVGQVPQMNEAEAWSAAITTCSRHLPVVLSPLDLCLDIFEHLRTYKFASVHFY